MRGTGVAIFALSLLAAAPAFARSYDCANPVDSAPEGVWEPSQEQEKQFFADREKLQQAGQEFMYRFCGRIEGGKRLIMIGALHVVDDYAVCDDELNYATFYDPETRGFGETIPHQKLCGHGMKIKRPPQ